MRTPPEADSPFERSTDDLLERMRDLHERLGDIYRVYVPARRAHAYVIHDPQDIKRVLVSNHGNYVKGFGFDRVKVLLGQGLITSEGEFWRTQRLMMQPLFHRQVVTRFAAVIDAANERLLERWKGKAALGESINVGSDMSDLALEVILQALFGADLDRLTEELGHDPFAFITEEPGRGFSFASRLLELRKSVALLVRRRAAAARAVDPAKPDYLGLLLEARDRTTGDAMTERALIDEVMTLIIAAHDTTASGLHACWYLISQHPDVESRLHAEIDLGKDAKGQSLAVSEGWVYTRKVIAEALRLYPPVWLLSRRAVDPDLLAGFEIPAGANVYFSPYIIQRDPKLWTDPDAFLPDRAEPDGASSAFARVPFSAGPRHCIGETLALYEMCIHLHRVARHYRLTHAPAPRPELEAGINLRIKSPVMMGLERR